VGYRSTEREVAHLPLGADSVALCEPIYEEMVGWKQSTVGIQRYQDLPAAAQAYLQRIEEIAGVPIDMVSTGADRSHTIILCHPLD
jgi:adenylosuccinate synthase